MKASTLPEQPDAKSPAGADIHFIMNDETGNMIHCTVPPHQINNLTNEMWEDMKWGWPDETFRKRVTGGYQCGA